MVRQQEIILFTLYLMRIQANINEMVLRGKRKETGRFSAVMNRPDKF
ncbi:hypothetical protein VA7868_01765 [Vibrio aerogenes CECT 7868]|uniref:Uncharacterized protein n=1 Tax=Vibrio aerogenes CECT 7868 TaxID=1216006 RepID=A0A1M5YIQ4_9VIBR|nr:hypothetical protein VA7868_01765 [Vibrio aerogenes CECT 7868]